MLKTKASQIIALTVAFVIFYTINIYIANDWLMFFLPMQSGPLFSGIYLTGAVFFANFFKKPGSAFVGGLIGMVVDSFFFSNMGSIYLLNGLAKCVTVELCFMSFKYKVWNFKISALAGAVTTLVLNILIYLKYSDKLPLYDRPFILFTTILSGIVLGGLFPKLLADALTDSGIFNRLLNKNIIQEKDTSVAKVNHTDKLDGWLIVFLMSLIFYMLIIIALNITLYIAFLSGSSDEPLAALVFLIGLGFITFSIYMVFTFFDRHGSYPVMAIFYCVLTIALPSSLLFLALTVYGEYGNFAFQYINASNLFLIMIGVIFSALWIPYFIRSKKVKVVFVKRNKNA